MLIKRYDNNPILRPKKIHSWAAEAVFNGCPIRSGDDTYLIFRALSLPRYHALADIKLMVSTIGIAKSKDGIDFHDRKCIITPEHNWERFGCEDPRVTKLGDKYYIFYTALSAYPFRADGIKIGLAISKDLYSIQKKHLVTPFNAKGMALFPEKINGKFCAALTVHTDMPPAKICVAFFDKEEEIWSEAYWQNWHANLEKNALPLARRPEDHVEFGAPPVKTQEGWLLLYAHIQNYFSHNRLFGIEAVLLDLENPLRVIAKTKFPLLTPEEYYERIGLVPNVTFPSGALANEDSIFLYYGAADTTCCLATINKQALLERLLKRQKQVTCVRANENPILVPNPKHSWEAKAVFNPAAIYLEGKVHILYRAMSHDNTSVLGYASSSDGINIDVRLSDPAYVPRESFEQKLEAGANTGCEDPRITNINDKLYMLYTAVDGRNSPRVALTSILVEDFSKQAWNWTKPVLISPPSLDDKNACVFPEKVHGQYFIIHRSGNDIDSAFSSTLDFDGKTWIEEYRWILPRAGMWDSMKVGIAAPPIKTKDGWILFYHGVSDEDRFYRVGAVLLDPYDPTHVVSRTDEPLFEPEMDYEKEGIVNNVVFPCGAVLLEGKIFLYYGGGDRVVGVATIDSNELLANLEKCRLFWNKNGKTL